MKFLIVFVALFAIAVAAPTSDSEAKVLQNASNVLPEHFDYGYETSNGIKADAAGHVQNPGTNEPSLFVKGQFSYIGDDGKTYTVSYTADQNGFQPHGAHLPVA